ncbi:MAG: phosphotransferase [Pseudomonadota bacterium]
MTLETFKKHHQILAEKSLSLWSDVPSKATISLLNIAENMTYLVEAKSGYKAILRIHREHYHSEDEIYSELMWMEALKTDTCLKIPAIYKGRNGRLVQSNQIEALETSRFMVLFQFIEGQQPTQNNIPSFEALGKITAMTHAHSQNWQKPTNFRRKRWDLDTILGPNAIWGNWRDAPGVDASIMSILEEVERVIKKRLNAFGYGGERFGLIHADTRLANLLVNDDQTHLIDFDDCGFGWYMYDFATSVSFMEDDTRLEQLKQSWINGYRTIKDLPNEDIMQIDSLIILRRLALLAWIGSRFKEATEAQAFADAFAKNSASLAKIYLNVKYP